MKSIANFPFHLLAPLYSESHRKYHNIEHIQSLIRLINNLDIQTDEKHLLKVIAWFHDVYYDPKASNGLNEHMSANLVDSFSDYLTKTQIKTIKSTVIATAHHTKDQPKLPDISKLFLDIDLHGLGSHEYHENGSKLREEYNFVTDIEYFVGRGKFLKNMLKRKTLFYIDYMAKEYQAAAIKNMSDDLNSIEKQLILLGENPKNLLK